MFCAVQATPFQASADAPSPTATHTLGEGHATAFRLLGLPGVGWIIQLMPFHRSTSGGLTVVPPTAMHSTADVQATALRKLTCEPRGFGVLWTVQLVPSHTSTSVEAFRPPWLHAAYLPSEGSDELHPTATHAVEELHDTPFNRVEVPGLAVGRLWIVQLVPSHRSASASAVPADVWYEPTAVHAAGAEHETATRDEAAGAAGAVGCTTQREPFEIAAKVAPLLAVPTTTQVPATQEIPFNDGSLKCRSAPLCTVHREPLNRTTTAPCDPTAVHERADAQLTSARPVSCAGPTHERDQRDPSQRSATG
jgi:hypothetical protein